MCIYGFWRGLLALGCTYLFLFCLPCHSKQSLLRSPDQSSVLLCCAHFVLFRLAVLSCMALVQNWNNLSSPKLRTLCFNVWVSCFVYLLTYIPICHCFSCVTRAVDILGYYSFVLHMDLTIIVLSTLATLPLCT